MRAVEEAFAVRDVELRRAEAELAARDAEIEARGARVDLLEQVAAYLSRLVVERDRELKGLRAELIDLRAHPTQLEALRARDEEGARALERLQKQVAEIAAQARGQATRIRMQALRQAVQLASRSAEERVVGELGKKAPVERPVAAASGAVDVFEGVVQMEVGPLRDFSQLVRFEDAVTAIGAASEISVKRFSRGRATLALRLEQPIELLRELERHAPFAIRVRGLRDDRVIVDVEEAA